MGAKLNKFYGEQLDTGKKQDIWIATTMSRACFREKTWENLSDMEFEYVVSLYPDAVRIRLKTGGILQSFSVGWILCGIAVRNGSSNWRYRTLS